MDLPLDHLNFHALFDAAAVAILLVDQTDSIILANPAALALLGYTDDEIYKLKIEALLPERYREQHRLHRDIYSSRPEQRLMSNGNNLVALTRDGRELPVSICLTPLKEQGQSRILITIYADRRHQAEESLRVSEERLRLAKRAAGFGVYDRDLTRNILYWDERSREIWGLPLDEVVTYEKFESSIHPEDREARNAAFCRALDASGNGEYQAEFRISQYKNGAERWVTTSGQVLFEAGHAVRLLGIMQDITQHKAMEQRLQEQHAETESLVKQQVAAQTASAIAHEINQPLTAISAYSEVALHALNSDSVNSEQLRHALEGCVKQTQRAGQSLHELLEFLQKGELVVEPMDLNSLVQEALITTKKNGYSGFKLAPQLESDLPPILGNALQVKKVLLNLLHNSIEAIRGAGVAAADITITVRSLAEKNMAQVTVQDSGPGLNAATVQSVFEPFFTTKPHGIGMGLAISRSLIEAHGGQLWLDPEAGPGATFHFTLPFAPWPIYSSDAGIN